jgi:hypothetical protein
MMIKSWKKNLKDDEKKGRKNQETWWKIEKQQSKMMKNKGKTMKHFKKQRKQQ